MEMYHILIVLGIMSFIVEIFTAGFVAGSIGIGLFLTSIANAMGLSITWQLIIFAFGVAVTYFTIPSFITKFGYKNNYLKTNRDAMIGKLGTVSEDIEYPQKIGRVILDGNNWQAITRKNITIKKDSIIKVIDIESTILIVENVNEK